MPFADWNGQVLPEIKNKLQDFDEQSIVSKIYFQSHITKVPLPLLSTRFLYIANELLRKERSPVAPSSKTATVGCLHDWSG
jgi:hypothetical protein